jgi:hypothetical protein
MARVLVTFVATLALSLLPAPAAAQLGRPGETYCVGGYDGRPPDVVAACARPEIQRHHGAWHPHIYVFDTRSKTCSLCYDEQDNTCETVFLRRNPQFEAADEYDCARLGEQHTSDQVTAHVIDGREQAAPPPPPQPTPLEAKVERITPGPYTAGDRISLVGAVRDDTGALRQVTGGTFRVTDAAGAVTEVPGSVQPDGRVTADYTLPPTNGLQVEFVPKVALGKNEVLRAAASDARSLQVEVCGLRARVVAPAEGESLVSEQPVSLRAALFDAAGKVPLASPPPGTTLEFRVQVDAEAPKTLPASSALEAAWTPPRSSGQGSDARSGSTPRQVRISVSGRAGDRVVCPAGEATMTVSDLGLAFDTSDLPRTCYVGLPCRGTVVLKRPAPGPGRAHVDRLLSSPGLLARQVDTGDLYRAGPPTPDDRYTFETTYTQVKSASWSIVFSSAQGEEVAAMPGHPVQVRPALRLELPAELDFGTVAAGTAVSSACQRLDFGRSQAVEGHRWELRAEGLQGCQSHPVLRFVNAAGQEDTRRLDTPLTLEALDPQRRWLDVCLEVPRCAADASPTGAALRVVPLTPEFASQATAVRLRWRVEGLGPLACHGFWLLPALGSLGAVVLLAGFTRPARFPPGAAVRIAGSERGLRQAASVLLRACPGSSPGFFRDARLGMQGDGNVTGRVRGAAVVLRAVQGGGVVLTGLGLVERQDRRTLKWEPVEDLASGHVPSQGVSYRAGGTFFQVEL